jgi:hypothetical protein
VDKKTRSSIPSHSPHTRNHVLHGIQSVPPLIRSQQRRQGSRVYDWIGLGLLTGHRLGEFGQSKLPTGSNSTSFDILPDNSHIPPMWRGKPKAFVRDDFSFYTASRILMSHNDLLISPSTAEFVHIRWRYDKSKFNFITKQYQRQHGTPLCPVKRAASIVIRSLHLRLPPVDIPMEMFTGDNAQRYTIRSTHIVDFMQAACVRAYPDPQHYFWLNISMFQAHSIRITACVTLDNAGVPHEDIALRLRWNSDAIKGYLRDCSRHIGQLTSLAVAGISAQADTTPSVNQPPHISRTGSGGSVPRLHSGTADITNFSIHPR